jgi:predicted LPLAT superfamily acyltransferase
MSSWEGKTRGGVLGYRIFVWTLRNLGLGFAYFLLSFVVVYFVFTSGKAFRSIFNFYHKVMDYGRIKSLAGIYRNYYMFGQILLDKIAMLAGFRSRFTFDFEGEEYLRRMHDGGILISERNVNFIVIRDDFSHLAEIRDALARKEIIAMHGDRFIEGNRTVRMDFLGKPALFPMGPVNMAAKFRVPVSFVFAVKETRSHYHFYATPLQHVPFTMKPALREENTRAALAVYLRKFEEVVRRYPMQWFNYYDFWHIPQHLPNPGTE